MHLGGILVAFVSDQVKRTRDKTKGALWKHAIICRIEATAGKPDIVAAIFPSDDALLLLALLLFRPPKISVCYRYIRYHV